MNINVLVMGLLALILSSYAWKAYTTPVDAPPPNLLPFIPISDGKSKVYVSPTKDAGMYIERQRRLAILQNKPLVPSFKGSTNGYLEYSLTAIGFRPPEAVCPPDPEPVIWSNGDADDVICDSVDAGGAFGLYEEIDFGGAAGNVCPP
jgi:hypothetical protein